MKFSTKQLSQGWKEVELEELIEIIAGQAPSSSSYNAEEKGKPFLRVNSFGEKYPISDTWTTESLKDCKKGDILLSVAGTIGSINIADRDYSITRSIFALRPELKKIDLMYLYFFLKTLRRRLKHYGTGSSQKIIIIGTVKKIKIPLPPLPIQKKIVSILEQAEQLKQKREQVDKLMDDYLKSVFNEMFLKKEFPKKELEKLTEIIMGQSPPGNSYNEDKNGMPFFQGKAEFTSKYPIIKKWTTQPSKISEPQSILMSVRAPVGDVNINNIKSCIGRGLASIKPSKEIEFYYLYYFLILTKDKIANLGSGSTFKAITSKQLKSLKIPLPPIALQQKFASIVEKVEKIKQTQKKSKQEINDLFNALMQKAFQGEL